MITIIKGDIFNAPMNQILCHQVSCQSKMGTGIALEIKKRYPDLFKQYVEFCETINPFEQIFLYHNQIEDSYIANMFSQYYYGRDKRYTNYEAFAVCLEKIARYAKENNLSLAFPYGIGCNNAGGNWKIIYTMIEEICVDIEVFIYNNRV